MFFLPQILFPMGNHLTVTLPAICLHPALSGRRTHLITTRMCRRRSCTVTASTIRSATAADSTACRLERHVAERGRSRTASYWRRPRNNSSIAAGILSNYAAVAIEAWAAFPNQLPVNCFFYGFGTNGASGVNYIFCAPRRPHRHHQR
jgi:hypothetical protein